MVRDRNYGNLSVCGKNFVIVFWSYVGVFMWYKGVFVYV